MSILPPLPVLLVMGLLVLMALVCYWLGTRKQHPRSGVVTPEEQQRVREQYHQDVIQAIHTYNKQIGLQGRRIPERIVVDLFQDREQRSPENNES